MAVSLAEPILVTIEVANVFNALGVRYFVDVSMIEEAVESFLKNFAGMN